jgi:hypothetical protein
MERLGCPAGTISTLKMDLPGDEWLGRLECRVDYAGPTGLAIFIRVSAPGSARPSMSNWCLSRLSDRISAAVVFP